MAGPPPDYNALASGMRDAAQEFDRMANHVPLTLADLQHSQQQLQQQLQTSIQQTLQQGFQQLRQEISQAESRQVARTANSFALEDTPLIVIQDVTGAGPPHWPAQATREQVKRIPGAHLNNILQFYNLPPGGTNNAKARKVLAHVGVRF